MDEIGKTSLDGEDVCVCVGFCHEDAIPQWAGKIALSGATLVVCLHDSGRTTEEWGVEDFARTLERNLPSSRIRRKIVTMSDDEWERFCSAHRNEKYSIVHFHIDDTMELPSSAADVKPKSVPSALSGFDDIVPLKDRLSKIVEVFSTSSANGVWPSVLFLGETGAGKTYAAERIHAALVESRVVKSDTFVSLNCGEFGPSDMNAALFGIEGGKFTDVRKDQVGAIEKAQGGILFLDEIGTLPIEL